MRHSIKKSLVILGLLTSMRIANGQTLNREPVFAASREELATQKDWLQYQHIDTDTWRWLSDDTNPYIAMWTSRESTKSYQPEEMLRLLEQSSMSIDRERMRLALALDYLEQGRQQLLRLNNEKAERESRLYDIYSQAISLLNEVNPEGLIGTEYTQWLVARGYILMARPMEDLDKARALFTAAIEEGDSWSERALLYLSMLEHKQGNSSLALRLLRQHTWSTSLAPEATYQQILIAQGVDTPEQTLREIQSAIKKHPHLSERARLIGAQGIAYYRLGDWQNAVRLLRPLAEQENLIPTESYALGASLYAIGQYTEAKPRLEIVAALRTYPKLNGVAQFALGNIYIHEQDLSRAKIAYTAVVDASTLDVPKPVLEESLYRLIELNFSSGYDTFGQQTRLLERFISYYPKSKHLPRVLDLVKSYCYISTDYPSTLDLINKLESKGLRLSDARQEVLVRYAHSLTSAHSDYTALLEQAISLGARGDAYTLALVMRGQASLTEGNYIAAERSLKVALDTPESKSSSIRPIAHYLLGYTYYNQQRYREAYKRFEAYIDLDTQGEHKAEALARMGDCILGQNESPSKALKYYEQSVQIGGHAPDEALRRIVAIHGLQGNYTAQIKSAEQFATNYPQSTYLAEVLYLHAKALALSNEKTGREAAAEIYNRIEQEFPSSEYAAISALEQALAYSSEGDIDHAIPAYKRVVERYPQTQEARTALSDLKALYTEEDRIDEYTSYAATLDKSLLPKEQSMEQLTMLALKTRINRGEDNAIDELKQWLSSHRGSPHAYEAGVILANTLSQKQRYEEAIEVLEPMAKTHTSADKQLELQELLARAYRGTDRLADMLVAYKAAYTLSRGNKDRRSDIAKEFIEAAYVAKEYKDVIQISTTAIEEEAIGTPEYERLIIMKGRAQEKLKAIKGAIQTYTALEGSYSSEYGAEACVRRAELMLHLGQSKEAEVLMESFISSGTPQQYWLARGFIALSDSYAAQGDRYLALQYLKNLKENYKQKDADIEHMISSRLDKLQ